MATKKTDPRTDDEDEAAERKNIPDNPPAPPPTSGPPHDPNADPNACRTIADEQRERSEDIQRVGVEAFKKQFDTRDPDAEQKTVPGVARDPKLEAFRR